jgi:hypothetical protein
MKTFFVLLIISFAVVLVMMLVLSFVKRRQARTSHGLTGICHESGGEMCGCCRAAYTQGKEKCSQEGNRASRR